MGKRLTLENFIKRASEKHYGKYDYSNVDYKNNSTKVCIICPEHGEFWQTPGNHLHGQGCPKCSGKGNNTESVVNRFKSVHGEKYDYSKVEFMRVDEKVCIVCPVHGEFWQEPRLHLKGMGCRYCSGKDMTNNEFIRRSTCVHGTYYDYSRVKYINNKAKVCIICPEHGEFWQTPNNHLQGNGCPKCGYEKSRERFNLTIDEFLLRAKSIHGNKYDYSKVDYKNVDEKVCIICPEHGEFWQTPYKHYKNGQGCPKCNSSHLENEIRLLLTENKIEFEEQKTFDWLKCENCLRLDFFLPDYGVAIECQGEQHFRPVDFAGRGNKWADELHDSLLKRDKIKNCLCKKHKIIVFYYANENYDTEYTLYTDKNLLLNEIKFGNATVDSE